MEEEAVKRFGAVLVAVAIVALCSAVPAGADPGYTASGAVKINVMGEWAHPDDDTSIIGPCGVWHQRYDVKCGLIMVSRGEGGGNAVGSEIGRDLGLRRENEDRVAHYRSGTIDIFNIDRVDFFYNQSAPLTQYFWGREETLRRITRIIRMTQPDIYIGFSPTQQVGHGNHQQAGRFIWEGVLAAADPNMFPEQLTGPNALSTWQVKKVFSGGSTAGTGGTTASPDCTTNFVPTGLDNVAGVWTGYDSPYRWPEGNVQGRPAGSPKSWAQVAMEGARAHPTQSRVMWKDLSNPACSRFGMTDSFVPFQPNVNPSGTNNANAGQDHAILYGAVMQDPGGLPLGTQEYLTFSRFFNAPGAPFEASVHLKAPAGRSIGAGSVTLNVPAGWAVDAATKPIGASNNGSESTATFLVTPPSGAAVNQQYKISATVTSGSSTGYTDDVVRVVPPAEGRFQRWGNWQEYDEWLSDTAPQASRLGRSGAVQTMGVGETITVPVVVHNWSTVPQSGNVTLTLPAGVTADATTKPYGPVAPGDDTTVNFSVSNSFTNATLPGPGGPGSQNQNVSIGIATSYAVPAGTASENLTLGIVPKTTIPAGGAPTLDGNEGAGEYTGEALDIGRKWEPGGNTRNCDPVGVDCGSSSAPGTDNSTYAKVTRSGDDLYFFIHVRDEFQSYAVTPEECVGHWLADSVEILIDPRGNSSQRLRDTGTTFKLGVFPFTNDPTNRNGNGVNGPCWARDADNHQGYSTGPLADTVEGAPNAPGVEVRSTATWVGTNDTTTSHSYGSAGGYNLEVKIPMSNFPAAVDPDRMGLNITPYDNDDSSVGTGSTLLRHNDVTTTRLAWSTFGSVQSDPYRWGLATLTGYTPPAGRPTTPAEPYRSQSNLNGVDSPQTIYQSAHNGVPIAGRPAAPANDRITRVNAVLDSASAEIDLDSSGAGRAHVFLWTGDPHGIPVWNTSCSPAQSPWPDYGLSACSAADGTTPAWSPNMSGRVVRDTVVTLAAGTRHLSIPLDAAARELLAADGRVLVSFETRQSEAAEAREVQAIDAPFGRPIRPGTPATTPGRCGNEVLSAATGRTFGTALGDFITGRSISDRIDGLAGDDCIDGRGGNDDLRGGAGHDSIEGATGHDRIRGGSGRGTLRGGPGNDRIDGGSSKDVINANSGNDRVNAGAGNDVIFGQEGVDRITGGKGRDSIESGSGNDRIWVKDGRRDTVDCGRGRDTVVSRDRMDKLTNCEVRARP
jgi:LmbE family N-acetylglucosaminyl deacetylase/Ca2+-binding RTX toxin-like protein